MTAPCEGCERLTDSALRLEDECRRMRATVERLTAEAKADRQRAESAMAKAEKATEALEAERLRVAYWRAEVMAARAWGGLREAEVTHYGLGFHRGEVERTAAEFAKARAALRARGLEP